MTRVGALVALLLCVSADAAPETPPLRCRSRADRNKVLWWNPPMPPSAEWQTGTRYVCVNHGAAQHGYWWEARPQDRPWPWQR